MPHIFAQLPFPKGSQAVLEVFTTLTGLVLDLSELAAQAAAVVEQLGDLLEQVQEQVKGQLRDRDDPAEDDSEEDGEEPGDESEPADDPDADTARRVEELFAQAKGDRSKAFELKRELDRLGVFARYEDRFLDLFRTPDTGKP
jgi:hypothetical protein